MFIIKRNKILLNEKIGNWTQIVAIHNTYI